MSRMNAAWSNEPPWAEAVPAIFKEPMTIAFGGAILAHAIFFLGLPVVAGTEKQPDVQPVGTTVLTPEEKALIPPDLAQSQFSTGSLLPNNGGLIVPPLPSGSTTPGSTTIPGTNYGFGQPNAPAFSTGGYSAGSNNSSSDINAQLAEIARKQEEARKEQAKKTEIAKKKEAEDKERENKPLVTLPTVNANAMPPETPTGEQPKSPTNQSPANQPQQQPTRLSDKAIIDGDPERYASNENQTGSTIGDKGVRQLSVASWGTKPDSKEREILLNSGDQFPQPFEVDTKTKTLPYPTEVGGKPVAVIAKYSQQVKEATATDRFGVAVVGIAIDKQGNFASEPTIIQSTGYKILDDYAIEYVKFKSRRFPVVGRGKLYQMTIPIDPPINKPTA